MLDTADVTRQFIETIIEIIGRKTSEEYAAVAIQNLLKKLQLRYPFLREVEFKKSRSLEMEGRVEVQDALNAIPPTEVGTALKELVTRIMTSLGKNAGYFFLRETQEKIGIDYDRMLLKSMNIDLTLMQSTFIVEKQSTNVLEIQQSDVVRRTLKVLLDVVEKQTSKSFAIASLKQHVDVLQQQYPFLNYVVINDIRYTLGPEEIAVKEEINTIDPRELGRAITSILQEMDNTLRDLGRTSVAGDLKLHLTFEYLSKLKDMGVTIASQGIGYTAVFAQIFKTIIDVLGKKSSEDYAILAVNSFLRKIDGKYDFLKLVKIDPAVDQGELYHIIFGMNLDTINETDARRAIQQLLETILESLGEEISDQFIMEVKDSLDKKYLSKIEEMGVNFYMIELHGAMLNKIK